MMKGGHEEHFRVTVMTRVIGKYEANLKNHLEGTKLMYRSRPERPFYEGRRINKIELVQED